MPLSQVCEISDDVCCDTLWLTADHLLTNVYSALLPCYADVDCPDPPLQTYVTMGSSDDGVADSLIVTFSIAQANASPNTKFLAQRASFDVCLRESGWPMANAEGGMINAPDPAKQHALALHAFAHGEKMYRKLLSMKMNNDLSPAEVRSCNGTIGPLQPLTPRGGVVGFRVLVGVDMPWP